MVRVTGKSLETLYRYIAGEIGGKAPASHEHTQAQVTGLPDALNGKAAAKHGHEQADVAGLTAALDGKVVKSIELKPGTDLNTVTQSGFYRINIEHKNLPSGAEYGQLIVSRGADTIVQIVIAFSNSKVFCRSGNPAEVGGPGSWREWKRLYQEGDGVLAKFTSTSAYLASNSGWNYQASYDNYFVRIPCEGIKSNMKAFVKDHRIGPEFPLAGVICEEDDLLIIMMEIPTVALTIYVDVFSCI